MRWLDLQRHVAGLLFVLAVGVLLHRVGPRHGSPYGVELRWDPGRFCSFTPGFGKCLSGK